MGGRVRRRPRERVAALWLLVAAVGAAAAAAAEETTADPLTASVQNALSIFKEATSTNISVYLPCLHTKECENLTIEYKKEDEEIWNAWNINRYDESADEAATITDLDIDTKYDVRVGFKHKGKICEENLTEWTCPEQVPSLRGDDVDVVKTGPGWLYLRWRPVEDRRCPSKIYYLVQYGAQGGNFTDWTPYGVFLQPNNSQYVFRPTHPCTDWNKFCLLLTDEVQPGKNHTVKIKPVRYERGVAPAVRPAKESGAGAATVYAVADPDEAGPYVLGAGAGNRSCVPKNPRVRGAGDRESRRGHDGTATAGTPAQLAERPVVVPLWAIIVALIVLVAAVALFAVGRWRQRVASIKGLLPETPPGSSVPPSGTPGQRSSSVYDDCQAASHAFAAAPGATPEPVYEKLKGARGGLPAALAAAAAARARPCAAPAGNTYVAMGPGHPIYDDAHGLVRHAPGPSYSNVAGGSRDSVQYMEPGSPVYDDAKGLDSRVSDASVGYNRPYSQAKTGPWRGW